MRATEFAFIGVLQGFKLLIMSMSSRQARAAATADRPGGQPQWRSSGVNGQG
jgi:hypothetical protein